MWPRFNGRVVVNDTGIATYYGSNTAWLELTDSKAVAGYEEGKLELPATTDGRIAYLKEVIGFKPENASLRERLADMTTPPPELPADGATQETEPPLVREPISPGICQAGAF